MTDGSAVGDDRPGIGDGVRAMRWAMRSTGDRTTDRSAAGADRRTDLSPDAARAPPAPTAADRSALEERAPSAAADRGAALGLVVAAAGFVVGAGIAGGGAALLAALVWAGATPVYATAVGAVLVSVLELDLPSTALVGAGLGAALLASARHNDEPVATLGAATVAAGVVGVALVLALRGASLWVAAVALVGVVAAGLYGLHRYGLVHVVVGDVDG